MSVVIRMKLVPGSFLVQSYNAIPSIACHDDCIIASSMHVYVEDLQRFNFGRNKWKRIRHENLCRNFTSFTSLVMGQYLVIHGTTSSQDLGGIYSTYIGDLRQGSAMNFQLIGNQETPPFHEYRVVSDNVNNLYTIITHWSNRTLITTIKRLNVFTKIWTVLHESENEFIPQNPFRFLPKKHFVIFYESQFYMFSYNKRIIDNDFSFVTTFDLGTNTWKKINLLPTEGPLPGFPTVFPKDSYCSMAQCPTYPWNVYLTLCHNENPAWDVWRVDLMTLQWHKFICNGPALVGFSQLSTTVTPSGLLYVLRTPGNAVGERPVAMRPSRFLEQYGLFRAAVYVRRLEDECLDVAIDQICAVDPDWTPVRSFRSIMTWWSENDHLWPQQQ